MEFDALLRGAFIEWRALGLGEIIESTLCMLQGAFLIRVMKLVEVGLWPEPPVFRDASAGLSGIALLKIPRGLIPRQQSVIEHSGHLAGGTNKPSKIRQLGLFAD